MNDLVCPACGREGRTGATWPYRCVCGGLWSARDPEAYAIPGASDREARPPTPLWEDPARPGTLWKREDLQRTGSFKDRGAAVLARLARERGASRVVVDSSGSAALAAASAGAREGLEVTVHTPGDLAPPKREALDAFGVRLVAEGTREDAAQRVLESIERDFYLSHVYHPAFHAGTATAGEEVLRQTGGAPPPVWLVPVGNGSLFLGLVQALDRAALADVRLIAVQASACPGLTGGTGAGRTRAAGIGIVNPPRREQILGALRARDGEILLVSEEEIEAGTLSLGRKGVWADPAAGAVEAALGQLEAAGARGACVAWLTGSGLRG
jgi:threonine synthase